jgi:hypothetical protein
MIILQLAACGPKPHFQDIAGSSTTGPGTTEVTPTTTPTEVSGSISTDGTAGLTTATSTSASTGLMGLPDLPADSDECDPQAEMPCPEGQKCSAAAPEWSPWLLWTGTPACFPVLGNKAKGEVCDLGRDPVDGLDDCGAGTLCVDIYWLNGPTGICVEFCDPAIKNDVADPSLCDNPAEFCYGPGCQDCYLSVCIPACDPLLQDCPAGTGCVQSASNAEYAFACQGFWADSPAAGESCDLTYQCTPDATCVLSVEVVSPACSDSETCCTPFCDLNAPNTCPGAAMGEVCTPFYPAPYDPETEPWGVPYNKLGFCALP